MILKPYVCIKTQGEQMVVATSDKRITITWAHVSVYVWNRYLSYMYVEIILAIGYRSRKCIRVSGLAKVNACFGARLVHKYLELGQLYAYLWCMVYLSIHHICAQVICTHTCILTY